MNRPVTQPTSEPTSTGSGTFDDLPLHPKIRRGIAEMGYRVPTPIQQGAIPPAVLGRDIIGAAQTGTGKTAAFLLPILERLLEQPPGRIHALVLTPTRELALQAEGFLKKLAGHTHLRGIAVYGGVGMLDQQRALRGGAEIVVATPGRLLDHMGRGYVRFESLRILVLDEADRMLDMGFLPDVRRILSRLPRDRQTMLFSATMPPEVVRLSKDFLRDPRMVQVAETTVAAVGVSHLALPVPAQRKTELLCELLRDEMMSSVLVFVRTKHRADHLARQLERAGVNAAVIHGNRSQSQRVHALEGFRAGRFRVMVCTDIAARGIDVKDVSHVVNFDVPHEPETYVHRVGRTARAQRRGDAYSLVAPEEERDFAAIERILGEQIPRSSLPNFDYRAGVSSSMSGGTGRRDERESREGRRRSGPPRGGSGRRSRNGPPPRAGPNYRPRRY
ncbi:MAG: DEAD/DEAH box helicase [Thermoplasmata archaeon]